MIRFSIFLARALRTGASLLMIKYGNPVDSKQVGIKTDSRDANVSITVELTRDHDDLIATGCVRPRFGSLYLPLWRTVEVQMLSPQGKLIAKSSERCALTPLGSPGTSACMKRWPFQVHFHGMPPQSSVVEVTCKQS